MAEAVDIKKQIIDDMLETLKEQVSRYKSLINSNDVTLDQLKDFDNQISEIYDTLQKVSNTQLTLLVSEIEDYKTQFQTKLSEFENILNNIDVSNITLNLTPEQIESLKGDNGLSAYQIAVNEGFEGTELEWLESLKGLNGTFQSLTQEEKDFLKGEDGLSAYQIAVNEGFEGTELEWLETLKGDASLITVDSMTQQQKEEIANLVNVSSNFVNSCSLSYSVSLETFNHFRTNVKLTKPINFKFFNISSSSSSHSFFEVLCYFRDDTFRFVLSQITQNNFLSTFYLDSDGFLCLLIGGASYSDFIKFIFDDFSNPLITEHITNSDNSSRPWGIYNGNSYALEDYI